MSRQVEWDKHCQDEGKILEIIMAKKKKNKLLIARMELICWTIKKVWFRKIHENRPHFSSKK